MNNEKRKRKRVVVVCPGRGSYGASELGYLKMHGAEQRLFIEQVDTARQQLQQDSVSSLDEAEKFRIPIHTPGENASALIYTCAMVDFLSISADRYEIVAICGNSMGWYLTLAAASALDSKSAFQLVNTMGSMMKDGLVGGQIIHPICNDHWQDDAARLEEVNAAVLQINQSSQHRIYPSIHLGGYEVLAGDLPAIQQLLKILTPVDDRYPMKLVGHAAFHTPLMQNMSEQGMRAISADHLRTPKVAIIDGRGHIWQPYSTNLDELYQYTLGEQVTTPYDFSTSIEVALKEFAPDHLILLGPGSSLGPPVAQILIRHRWRNLRSKSDFMQLQAEDPYLLSMGRVDQRPLVV